MRLRELVDEMRNVELSGLGDPGILSIVSDSREAGPGALFAALPGCKRDGAEYIEDALKKGVSAILSSCIPRIPVPVPLVIAEDVRKALGEAADSFYRHPSQSLELVGVTGTNGKTTTAYLVRHIMNHAARRCGMLGTIEYDLGDKLETAPLTTPDAVRFTRSLAEMRDFGCVAAVVEASSHALDQERTWPHRFSCGIFTNLTRDHLDYHGDMDSYLAAKRILFERLPSGTSAVFNFHDPAAVKMSAGIAADVWGYVPDGATGDAPPRCDRMFRVSITRNGLDGQSFLLEGPGVEREFSTPLVGRHNVENCVGAILAALSLGVGISTIAGAVESFPGVPGRLERLTSRNGVVAFVDYAHTDDALRSVLSVLRPLVSGKLITVFGCGGDRDPGKRPLMAGAAEEYSDRIVVTSDNPRTEDPEKIIADILPGFSDAGKVVVNPERADAIAAAVCMAGPGDVVLVAGKGHEDYQIVGVEKRQLDDREVVREAFGG